MTVITVWLSAWDQNIAICIEHVVASALQHLWLKLHPLGNTLCISTPCRLIG